MLRPADQPSVAGAPSTIGVLVKKVSHDCLYPCGECDELFADVVKRAQVPTGGLTFPASQSSLRNSRSAWLAVSFALHCFDRRGDRCVTGRRTPHRQKIRREHDYPQHINEHCDPGLVSDEASTMREHQRNENRFARAGDG